MTISRRDFIKTNAAAATAAVAGVTLPGMNNNAHADEMSEKLADCRAIESDAERVACYDALAGGLRHLAHGVDFWS